MSEIKIALNRYNKVRAILSSNNWRQIKITDISVKMGFDFDPVNMSDNYTQFIYCKYATKKGNDDIVFKGYVSDNKYINHGYGRIVIGEELYFIIYDQLTVID